MGKKAFASLVTHHAWRHVHTGLVELTQKGRVVDHLTDGIQLSSKAAFHEFLGKLGCPLEDVAWASVRGGHLAYHVVQTALALR